LKRSLVVYARERTWESAAFGSNQEVLLLLLIPCRENAQITFGAESENKNKAETERTKRNNKEIYGVWE